MVNAITEAQRTQNPTILKKPVVIPAGTMVSLRATQNVSAVNVLTEARTSMRLVMKSIYLYIGDIPTLSSNADSVVAGSPSALGSIRNRFWYIASGRSLHILIMISERNAPLRLNMTAE